MSGWILTKGLQNLRDQVNAAFPDRDKTSDGTIGDAAHQAETSSHNPDDTPGSTPEWDGDPDSTPEVRAWDMDSDLRAAPATAQQVVDHIRNLPGVSSVLRYIIYNRKIYKASNGWNAETYNGASAHTEHIHFTGAFTQAADNNTTFDYRLEEIPVALTAADKQWILDNVGPNAMWAHTYTPAGSDYPRRADADLGLMESRRAEMQTEIETAVADVGAKVDALAAKVAPAAK